MRRQNGLVMDHGSKCLPYMGKWKGIFIGLLLVLFMTGCVKWSDKIWEWEQGTTQIKEAEDGLSGDIEQTLLDHGWPQIVIDAMEPALKEQICRDQVDFYSAQIVWYQEDVGPVKEYFYIGYDMGEDDPLLEHEIPNYDFCLILAVGTCYQNEKLEHFLCSLNYEWHTLPEDRKEDSYQLVWDGEVMRAVYRSVCCGWSQISKDQHKEGLGAKLARDTGWASLAEWETCLTDGGRWNLQGLAGSGWLQLWIPEGILELPSDTTLRGTYMYEKKNMFIHEGRSFDVDLKLVLPPMQKGNIEP